MKCSRCGNEINPGDAFCMNCGAPVGNQQPQQGDQGQPPYRPQGQPPYRPQGQPPYRPQGQPPYQRQGPQRQTIPQGQPYAGEVKSLPYHQPAPQPFSQAGSGGVLDFLEKNLRLPLKRELSLLPTSFGVQCKYGTIALALLVLVLGFLPAVRNGGQWATFYGVRKDSDIWWFAPMLRYCVMWVILFVGMNRPLWAIPGVVVMIYSLFALISILEGFVSVGLYLMAIVAILLLAAVIVTRVFQRKY